MFKNFIKVITAILIIYSVAIPQISKMRVVGKAEKIDSEIVGKIDANARFCAGIKVVSDLSGLKYKSNNGVVAVNQNPGMDMVYVSANERVLEIYNSGYEPLQIILNEYDMYLTEKSVWQIKITGSKNNINIPVNFITEPSGATIFIDGKQEHRCYAGYFNTLR